MPAGFVSWPRLKGEVARSDGEVEQSERSDIIIKPYLAVPFKVIPLLGEMSRSDKRVPVSGRKGGFVADEDGRVSHFNFQLYAFCI